jgi:hypothetical protein
MRLEPTAALLALLVPLGSLNCSDPERADSTLLGELERVWAPSGQLTPLTPLPAHCRAVASQRQVRVAGASGEARCQFDAASAQLACRTALGHDGELTTSEFASSSDFVEAAHALGKVTSLREVRRSGDSRWVTSHEYDELGRLIRSREERAGGDRVYSYRDFDAQGRPRQALPTRDTIYAWGCEVVPFTIEYGDATGTVSYRYAASAACDQPGYSIIEQYDALAPHQRRGQRNDLRSQLARCDTDHLRLSAALGVAGFTPVLRTPSVGRASKQH